MFRTRVQFPPSPHPRTSQVRLARFGGLGDQIVRFLGRKNQLAILLLSGDSAFEKRKFSHKGRIISNKTVINLINKKFKTMSQERPESHHEKIKTKEELVRSIYVFTRSLEESWEQASETHETFVGFFDNDKLREIIRTTDELYNEAEKIFGPKSPLSYVASRLRNNAMTIDRIKNSKDGFEFNEEKLGDEVVHFTDKVSIINEMRIASEESQE